MPNDMRSQPREGSLVHLRRHQCTPALRSRRRQLLRVGAGSRLLAAGNSTNALCSLAACAHIHACHMHSCLPRRQLVRELLIESCFPIRRRFRGAPHTTFALKMRATPATCNDLSGRQVTARGTSASTRAYMNDELELIARRIAETRNGDILAHELRIQLPLRRGSRRSTRSSSQARFLQLTLCEQRARANAIQDGAGRPGRKRNITSRGRCSHSTT